MWFVALMIGLKKGKPFIYCIVYCMCSWKWLSTTWNWLWQEEWTYRAYKLSDGCRNKWINKCSLLSCAISLTIMVKVMVVTFFQYLWKRATITCESMLCRERWFRLICVSKMRLLSLLETCRRIQKHLKLTRNSKWYLCSSLSPNIFTFFF